MEKMVRCQIDSKKIEIGSWRFKNRNSTELDKIMYKAKAVHGQ